MNDLDRQRDIDAEGQRAAIYHGKKATGIDTIAPPPRKPAAIPMTETHSSGDRVMVNVRISPDRAEYLRMLSAKTRTHQQTLIERAIDLLRMDAGEV